MKLMMDRPSEQVGQLAVYCHCIIWLGVMPWLDLAAPDDWPSEQEGKLTVHGLGWCWQQLSAAPSLQARQACWKWK